MSPETQFCFVRSVISLIMFMDLLKLIIHLLELKPIR